MFFKRRPVPEHLALEIDLPGGKRVRCWGDAAPPSSEEWLGLPDEEIRSRYQDIYGKPHHYLAISGGGANGAFGAGFLRGWTESGTRPEFVLVTGISTGALAAPFAFLGSEYDDLLEHVYTEYSTKDLVRKHLPLAAFTSGGLLSTKGLRKVIEHHITQDIADAIGAEYRKGRNIWIGTTNLDTLRPMIWGLGQIAASGREDALPLMRNILLASASIPIAFPPVKMKFEIDGVMYDELHADGGAAAQVFLFPSGLKWSRVLEKLAVPGRPKIYMIRNSKYEPSWSPTKPWLLPVAFRTVSSLIRTQGIGDTFRVYLAAQRDNCDFHISYIPPEFREIPIEQFDPAYMRKLYEHGRSLGASGEAWETTPPGF